MTDPNLNPYTATGELSFPEPRKSNLSVARAVVASPLILIVIACLFAAKDLYFFAFHYDSVSSPWHRANTPALMFFVTLPLIVFTAVLGAILRPSWRVRGWLAVLAVCLLPTALAALSYLAIDHHLDYEVYTSPGTGIPGKTLHRKADNLDLIGVGPLQVDHLISPFPWQQ